MKEKENEILKRRPMVGVKIQQIDGFLFRLSLTKPQSLTFHFLLITYYVSVEHKCLFPCIPKN